MTVTDAIAETWTCEQGDCLGNAEINADLTKVNTVGEVEVFREEIFNCPCGALTVIKTTIGDIPVIKIEQH